MKIPSRKKYRNFIVVYINPSVKRKLSGSPTFFKFRLNSNNWKSIPKRIQNMGFAINSVMLVSEDRQSGFQQKTSLYSKKYGFMV